MAKYIFLLPILLISLVACSNKKKYQDEIKQLEESLSQEVVSEKARELQAAYLSYVDEFPEDTLINSRYLYRSAGLSYRMREVSEALSAIHQALDHYYPSDNTPNNALLLAQIYQADLRKEQVAYTILQGMELSFPGTSEQAKLELPDQLPEVFERLDALRKQIFDERTFAIDFPLANDYITSIEEFARVAPRHPQSPELLFKAAEIARSIQTYQKAIELFDWLENRYVGHEREAQALFLKAFTLDDGLRDYDAARLAYQEFIEKYPNDAFADDARFSLKNLGKNVEDLINEFEQQKVEE